MQSLGLIVSIYYLLMSNSYLSIDDIIINQEIYKYL
jgi:hypothetical protein